MANPGQCPAFSIGARTNEQLSLVSVALMLTISLRRKHVHAMAMTKMSSLFEVHYFTVKVTANH